MEKGKDKRTYSGVGTPCTKSAPTPHPHTTVRIVVSDLRPSRQVTSGLVFISHMGPKAKANNGFWRAMHIQIVTNSFSC